MRFRTLGCYPLTGAIESSARPLDDIVAEMRDAGMSERQGRLIDTTKPPRWRRRSARAISDDRASATASLAAERCLLQPGRHGLLRFLTCGSVDDGKSTLIGRLLYDTKLIFDDQLAALEPRFAAHGTTGDDIDFALLVDGLEAEREQGITIDVAYRFFATAKRSFIVADTPGHEQYTRNMATGASNADLAVILIDARKGVLVADPAAFATSARCSASATSSWRSTRSTWSASTRRSSTASSATTRASRPQLGFAASVPIPISARFGDNVTAK